ncbi:hypothetical protein K491DRAFT_719493 [Lophiostoma macrostomum CBS 122681]|uniref:Uncharacterized protein n=1 Tax=Lophiostoma macrostomum CBS 122681 TaxID=1314788 RepID=A0A6A6SVP2_9PLEO|nr:hypothetical protein K491DRAFT_719493 [Lophiostoma macrostomum CBS 122681]
MSPGYGQYIPKTDYLDSTMTDSTTTPNAIAPPVVQQEYRATEHALSCSPASSKTSHNSATHPDTQWTNPKADHWRDLRAEIRFNRAHWAAHKARRGDQNTQAFDFDVLGENTGDEELATVKDDEWDKRIAATRQALDRELRAFEWWVIEREHEDEERRRDHWSCFENGPWS